MPYSPWDGRESDVTEQLTLHNFLVPEVRLSY